MACRRRLAIGILVALVVLPLGSGVAVGQTLDEANRHINDGWAALNAGNRAADAGVFDGALEFWGQASWHAWAAIDIGAANGVPWEQRPSAIYHLRARAELNTADVLIRLRAPAEAVDPHLWVAFDHFDQALNLADIQEPFGSPRRHHRLAENLFGLATIHFIRGEYEPARGAIGVALSHQPGDRRLEELRAAIDYTLGTAASLPSVTGAAVPEAPRQGLSGSRALDYAREIAKALFGRWGTVVGMVMDDVFQPGAGNRP
jgi:hypothetical protein